jgi:hypothetical protein
MSEEFIDRLKKLASGESWADEIYSDSSVVDDFACGNVDDAFWGGHRSGEIQLARDILNELKINWWE